MWFFNSGLTCTASISLQPIVWLTLLVALLLPYIFRRVLQRNLQSQRQLPQLAKKPAKPDLTEPDFASIEPVYYDWKTEPEIAYRPWHDGPYNVTMGLKNLKLNDWIEIDETYLTKYNLKKKLYKTNRDEVLVELPGCDDGLHESLHYLKDLLCRRYPKMFRLRKPDIIENLITGDVWDLGRDAETWEQYHPLEIMGLLATEDFFLLRTDAETGISKLCAAGSCFPAGFKIEKILNRSLWEIHAGKVPQYEQKLAKSMDRFFQKLRVDSPIQRFNYAIDDSDELFHRHSHHNLEELEVGSGLRLEDLHLRVERQVLQRLPKSRDLLFSIRTYVTPITKVTEDKDIARALRTSVSSFGVDVARYKNKALWNDILQKHIAGVLGEESVMNE